MRLFGFFGAAALCVVGVPAAADNAQGSGHVVAAWSQFVPGSTAPANPVAPPSIELRFVVDAVSNANSSACDSFVLAYRDQGGNQGLASAGKPRANPDSQAFPVTTCATLLDAGWSDVQLIAARQQPGAAPVTIWDNGVDTGISVVVPGPHAIGRRHQDDQGNPELLIATLGDSGCRGGTDQDCQSDWPFQAITQSAAAQQPDLFVHTGDYRYYRQSDTTKRWEYWLKDLLVPARTALLAAPWALARGNHETCDFGRSGMGFTFLFGVNGANCSVVIEPSWHFDVAPGGFDSAGQAVLPHRFVMIDSSNEGLPPPPGLTPAFSDAIDQSASDSVWWVTHVPPVHLLNYGGKTRPSNPDVLSQLAQAVAAKGPLCTATANGGSQCRPSVILLGHDHLFQSVTFPNAAGQFDWPQVYVVGHGGVDLRSAKLRAEACTYQFPGLPGVAGTRRGIVNTREGHGFVLWRRSAQTAAEPSGWIADPRDASGTPWAPFAAATRACLNDTVRSR